MEVLQWLRSKGLLRPLVFGGGTMLRLCHEMPRYSLDMDFWFHKEVEYDSFYHQLENLISQEYDDRYAKQVLFNFGGDPKKGGNA
ncbi:MAG: nucleotidyl transferase AbiEii/AbiGii toxin family protein [Deltaproteobacteria bacterium]|nr:nucleotidyl transferase AbiEii/AbiGii toxin family protein [Deltaproteobacteria bacterium]